MPNPPPAAATPSSAALLDAQTNVLVIGEPLCDPSLYPPLPGAKAEARAVVAQLEAGSDEIDPVDVRALISGADEASTVLNACFERAYRVVHITGHATTAEGIDLPGVALSGNTVLGAAEFAAMRVVPELVFISCGHEPPPSATQHAVRQNRAAFAARFARELLAKGVRCVVVAGWTVEEAPALQFAGTLYQALLVGERFIDAVALAREAAWRHSPRGNTWGAYQCCGDPDWRWHPSGDVDADELEAGEAMASPSALLEALDRISNRAEAAPADLPRLLRQALALELRHGAAWGQLGQVAQAFGRVFGAVDDDDDRAIGWYAAGLEADNNALTFKAVERLAWHLMRRAAQHDDLAEGRRDATAAIRHLKMLLAFQRTGEREYLLAVALKISGKAQARVDRKRAMLTLRDAYDHFEAAYTLAGSPRRESWTFGAGRQQLAVEHWMTFLDGSAKQADRDSLRTLRRVLDDMAAAPGISTLDRLEMRWLEAITHGTLTVVAPEIVDAMRNFEAQARPTRDTKQRLHEACFTIETYGRALGGTEGASARHLVSTLEALANA